MYSIPIYKEVNPGMYTIITFPFLFGVMYGDIGHGSVLLFVATLLVCFDGKIKKIPGLEDLSSYRYVLFLMAFFAVFSGFMYNDFMSVPLNLFDSCYNAATGIRKDQNCVYPMGIDPIWYGTKQELIFLNSFKMKFSVIVGVLHMVLGLAQKAINALHFKDLPKFYHEFLPQLIFLLAVFGYMDFLIIVKWFTNYKGHEDEAPSIIVTVVNFFLNGGEIKGREFISHNVAINNFLLLIALVCIPWMLLVKPYLEY
jgi:V-type H+-transporting ATPase subunit a